MKQLIQNISFDKYLLLGKKAAGVHYVRTTDTDIQIDVVIVSKIKDEIVISSQKSGLTSFEELVEFLPTDMPIYLTVSGKGLLSKMPPNDTQGIDSSFKKVFPMVNIDDFVCQANDRETKHTTFYTIIRKEVIQNIISKFDDHGYLLHDLCLGPIAIQSVHQYTTKHGSTLELPFYTIQGNDSGIASFTYHEHQADTGPKHFNIEGLEINPDALIPFSSALSFFIPPGFQKELLHFEYDFNEFNFKKYFKFTLLASCALFVVLLLINFLIFTKYNEKHNTITGEFNRNRQLLVSLQKAQEEYKTKSDFIAERGLSTQSKTSYYIDQIAMKVPKSIQLEELHLNPLVKQVKNNKEIHYHNNTVQITGNSADYTTFSTWVNEPDKPAWVSEVEIKDYTKDQKLNSMNFTIEIHIKE